MTDGAIYSLKGKKVWVAGHRGMVGAALMRRLASEDCELLTVTRDTVDLRRQAEVEGWLAEHRPEAVFIPAARVGGILANDSFPAEFLYDNLMIEANIINAAWQNGDESAERPAGRRGVCRNSALRGRPHSGRQRTCSHPRMHQEEGAAQVRRG